jgi:hypothetical protein
MSATQYSDVSFVPKVWSDHIEAYFNTKLGVASLGLMDRTLTGSPGETVNFPYYKAIGAAQEPAETEGLEVEALQDDSFSCTVKEIGKAVGWKDKALVKSAAGAAEQHAEAQRQIGRVFAEKVESDCITLINTSGNYVAGFVGTASGTHNANIRLLLQSKITGFGDKQDQAVAIVMHSQDYLNMMIDSTAGFLQANATDPMYGQPGFMGRILDMALFVLDSVPQVSGGINGHPAYYHFIFKANPFGIYMKRDMSPEQDRDILHRETVVSSTMWYGTCGLHAKVASNDYRVCRGAFTTSL